MFENKIPEYVLRKLSYPLNHPVYIFLESDFFLAIVTFVSCLILPLEQGILVGIGINLIYILYHAARPKISVEKRFVSSFLITK